ncbi:MAG TPA: hypothetical protein VHM91_16430 [Verrucomicrobiales bacterium]|jgi:hypothetical protein|nr:hypothetical protein [Verrucomicrobiales bacterium]
MKRLSVFPAALACLSFGLSACNVMDQDNPKPRNHAADPKAVVPQDFLFSRYHPLNAWLDQAVRVQIMDVPLMDVFNHQTLRGLQYVVVKAPTSNPLINIDKLAMTRRQLLWALAHDHQLHMTPAFGPGGEVTSIEIRSRSVDLPNKY